MKKLFLILSFYFCFIFTSFADVYAVVVGVSDYQNPQVKDLSFCDDDARDFYKMLVASGVSSSNIALLIDSQATKSSIISQMNYLFAKAKPSDRIIFYFSGHGDTGYFLQHDFSSSNRLNHTDVKAAFKKSVAKTKLCFADACMAGSIKKGNEKETTKSNSDANEKTVLTSEEGIVVMMSSRSYQTSQELQQLEQGAFTYYLIYGMQGYADADRNKIVTITELYNYIRKEVMAKTNNKQIPIVFGKFELTMPVVYL